MRISGISRQPKLERGGFRPPGNLVLNPPRHRHSAQICSSDNETVREGRSHHVIGEMGSKFDNEFGGDYKIAFVPAIAMRAKRNDLRQISKWICRNTLK
jgi:hypothetical protein